MTVKLLTEHHLEFLSLKGGCTGSSETTLVKMPHCWKSHATAQILPAANCHIPTLLLVVDMETWFTEKLTACSARNITGSVNGLLHSPSSTDPSLSQEIQNDLKLKGKNIQKDSFRTIKAVYETLVLMTQSKTTIVDVSPQDT